MVSLPLSQKHKGVFSSIHCEKLVELLLVKLTTVWQTSNKSGWAALDVFIFQSWPSEFPAIYQWQVRFFYPSTRFHWGFCSCIFALVSSDSLYLPICLSNFGVNGLPYDLISMTAQRRVVDFSAYSSFCCLLGWRDYNQLLTCQARNQKCTESFKFDLVPFVCFCFQCSFFTVTSKKLLSNLMSWNIPLYFIQEFL